MYRRLLCLAAKHLSLLCFLLFLSLSPYPFPPLVIGSAHLLFGQTVGVSQAPTFGSPSNDWLIGWSQLATTRQRLDVVQRLVRLSHSQMPSLMLICNNSVRGKLLLEYDLFLLEMNLTKTRTRRRTPMFLTVFSITVLPFNWSSDTRIPLSGPPSRLLSGLVGFCVLLRSYFLMLVSLLVTSFSSLRFLLTPRSSGRRLRVG